MNALVRPLVVTIGDALVAAEVFTTALTLYPLVPTE